MAASVISFSLDVSVESVGSSFPRVILISSISVEVLVALKVGAAVASPVGVLELDTHSSSEADPLESLLPHVSVTPMVFPFQSSDDSESDTKIPERHVSPITSIPEIPTAPILPAPSAIVHHHLSFHLHLLLPHPEFVDDELFLSDPRRTFLLVDFTILILVGHYSSSGEAYLRWRFAPLSTMYPPSITESSARDSSFESSVGPSRKRCRSPAATVTLSIHGIDCLPNEEIFTKLARMGYKKPSTKLIFYKAFFLSQWNLVRNVDSSTKFYMYPRFLELMIRAQVGDLTSHSTKYSSLVLTQKVFANMRRVGKGFSRVDTPLFEGMIVAQQVGKGAAEVNVDDVSTAGVADEGTASVGDDDVPTVVEEPSIPSPTLPTQPPQPLRDIPSTSQRVSIVYPMRRSLLS
nr:hypothetical protein [Tanacetum cinerariifolium]